MSIDVRTVRHVAQLARLELTPGEEEAFAAQLSKVLEHIETLAGVDVSQVQPLAFAGEASGSQGQLRADVALPGLAREQALAAAPQSDGQSFLVPRILE